MTRQLDEHLHLADHCSVFTPAWLGPLMQGNHGPGSHLHLSKTQFPCKPELSPSALRTWTRLRERSKWHARKLPMLLASIPAKVPACEKTLRLAGPFARAESMDWLCYKAWNFELCRTGWLPASSVKGPSCRVCSS